MCAGARVRVCGFCRGGSSRERIWLQNANPSFAQKNGAVRWSAGSLLLEPVGNSRGRLSWGGRCQLWRTVSGRLQIVLTGTSASRFFRYQIWGCGFSEEAIFKEARSILSHLQTQNYTLHWAWWLKENKKDPTSEKNQSLGEWTQAADILATQEKGELLILGRGGHLSDFHWVWALCGSRVFYPLSILNSGYYTYFSSDGKHWVWDKLCLLKLSQLLYGKGKTILNYAILPKLFNFHSPLLL